MKDKEIRARLDSKGLYVLDHVKHPEGHYPYDTYTVIFNEDGKTKLGTISSPYYYLHGINTQATFNGRRYWFQSSWVADEMPDIYLEHMKTVNEGYQPRTRDKWFQLLDTSKLEFTK